jgi:uncharacterized membrane protein YhhN
VTATALVLFALTAVVAVADWIAVAQHIRPLEYVAKPLTMVVLIGAVLALEPTSAEARGAFVVALVCSLAGDVFLMTKRGELFVFGLGAFLAGHVAYTVGLWWLGVSAGWLLAGLVIVIIALATFGLRVDIGVRHGEHADMRVPVLAYMAVISLMVASAFGTHRPAAIVGAVLFYVSDSLIAWTRFIEPKPWGDLAVIVTYHLGQLGLALSLIG